MLLLYAWQKRGKYLRRERHSEPTLKIALFPGNIFIDNFVTHLLFYNQSLFILSNPLWRLKNSCELCILINMSWEGWSQRSQDSGSQATRRYISNNSSFSIILFKAKRPKRTFLKKDVNVIYTTLTMFFSISYFKILLFLLDKTILLMQLLSKKDKLLFLYR